MRKVDTVMLLQNPKGPANALEELSGELGELHDSLQRLLSLIEANEQKEVDDKLAEENKGNK